MESPLPQPPIPPTAILDTNELPIVRYSKEKPPMGPVKPDSGANSPLLHSISGHRVAQETPSAAHFAGLATETVTHVFSYLTTPDLDNYGNIRLSWPSAKYEQEHPLRVLVRLSLVCRRWRDIVLGTPELWSHVAYPKQEHSVQYLARSGCTSLSLAIRATSGQAEDIIASVDGRIAELLVRESLQYTSDVDMKALVQYLASSTTLPARLRSVTLIYHSSTLLDMPDDAMSPQGPGGLLLEYLRSPKPHLQCLALHGCPFFPRQPPIISDDAFPRLKSLRISRSTGPFNAEAMRRLLRAMPNLESLCIDTAFTSNYPLFRTSFVASTRTPPITLPRLRELWVSSNLAYSAFILPMIKPPALSHTPRRFKLNFRIGGVVSADYYASQPQGQSANTDTMKLLSLIGLSAEPYLEGGYSDESVRVLYESALFSFSEKGTKRLLIGLDEKEPDSLDQSQNKPPQSSQHSLELSLFSQDNSEAHYVGLAICCDTISLPALKYLSIENNSSLRDTHDTTAALKKFCLRHPGIQTLQLLLATEPGRTTFSWIRDALLPLHAQDTGEERLQQILPQLTRLVVKDAGQFLNEGCVRQMVRLCRKRTELGWSVPLLQMDVSGMDVKGETDVYFEEVWESRDGQTGSQGSRLYRYRELGSEGSS